MSAFDMHHLANPLIAMIHVPALPGTPRHSLSVSEILKKCETEAETYRALGVGAIIVENMHDVPYLPREVGPEITATMTRCLEVVKTVSGLPVGVQILAGANKAALATALASGCDFIRAEGFIFGHIADEGWLNADAGELMRYRKLIGAEHIQVFTDIKKKHSSHAVTSDLDVVETVKAAEFFLSDGVIITGTATGEPVLPAEAESVRNATTLPVLIGSGITPHNIHLYRDHADAFIVGSWIKQEGDWKNGPDPKRVEQLMKKL